ncbi:type II CAAX prenyl endopeptidase Rce1 family protein [Synechococcus sp. CBW1107]|uniref:CPBP family glutamic-type intramembrane protease n=1 Tax=Synechococcus sp. CBW1107 TaxID=2789857 RepID=UPI001E2F86EF|nr:CPBP family glutamic-type intramembrane protease [Synechococcus sp. CBW1107]
MTSTSSQRPRQRRGLWPLLPLLLLLTLAVSQLLAPSVAGAPATGSSYALAQAASFNRPSHYPLDQRPDPRLYQAHADWIGRLILPGSSETDRDPGDWVWIEIEHAPPMARELEGQVLRLEWAERPALRELVERVSTDVRFAPAAQELEEQGNLLPRRLDGRLRVGPLQSLAGARPNDDLIVQLEEVELTPETDGSTRLSIGRPPLQITGRYVGLGEILGPVGEEPDHFRVRHWSPSRGDFSGPEDVVRVPQQPRDRFGRWISTPRGFSSNPLGAQGWYLYGAPDAEGLFTVQAIRPRALHRLHPDAVLPAARQGIPYILHGNWADTPRQRGRIRRVLLEPAGSGPSRQTTGPVGERWRPGDRALLIHSFGGIGGPGGERISGFTVTGHFAFGEARVVSDAITGEPRFDLRYHQIYANNPNGIVSGTQDWTAFSGDLQRGWMGSRPISDVLIKLQPFDDLTVDGRPLSLLRELAIQAEVLMARYRSGDGTGVSTVTPSTSCVQDSSQALYIAIDRLRRRAAEDPGLRRWLQLHPQDSASRAIRQLARLSSSLDQLLTPFGTVRSDWRHNASVVAGETFVRGETGLDALMSWRSMLPRRAHDDMARVFLQHGASLWFLRSNQLAGGDTTIEPLAPTLLLGQIPMLSILLRRFSDALFAPLGPAALGRALAILAIYAALALPLGWRSGFLSPWRLEAFGPALRAIPGLLLMPALGEELVFRVALLPHPLEGGSLAGAVAWGVLSVGLFVLYHPLAARCWYPPGRGLFRDGRFLMQCALLGAACVLAYGATGSVWPPVLLHGLAVTLWLWGLGGRARMQDLPQPIP